MIVTIIAITISIIDSFVIWKVFRDNNKCKNRIDANNVKLEGMFIS